MKRPSKLASILIQGPKIANINKEFHTLHQSKSTHDHQPF
jgi:hypothetical protein